MMLSCQNYTYLPFSLVSLDSFKIPGWLEIFEIFSGPKEFSALVRNADDVEEDGIMTDDEDDLDTGADELLPDNDTKDSLINGLQPASTKIFST
jgi:hypothetical protein